MLDYSVLMSVYHKEKPENLRMAIQSMLNQTVSPDDFVLVCDGPLNAALDEIVETYQRRYPALFQVVRLLENSGLGNALKEGLQWCRHEIVARMDSDDIAMPDRIEKQLAVLEEQSDVSVVGGHIAEFAEYPDQIIGYRVVPLTPEMIRREASFRNPMNHVTTVFRKQDILEVGSYQSLLGFEDYYLWARLLHAGKTLSNLNENLCFVRVADAMYRRRGGVSYFQNTVTMQKYLYRYGLVTHMQYMRNVVLRFFGTVVIPNKLRGILFKCIMRRRTF